MIHQCGWCCAELRQPDGKDDHLISYGICKQCAKEAMEEAEKDWVEYEKAKKKTL